MLIARLRELRAEYKLSIRDLERRSGVSRSTISLLEHGLRRPRESTLGWLAVGLTGMDGAEPVKQEIVPGRVVDLWGYNGSAPGPTIQITKGDRVRIIVDNHLPEATSMH